MFGFNKIIPRISEASFASVIAQSANAETATALWDKVIAVVILML